MLPLFNSLLAQIIVLALLLVLLAAPFLSLWVALSIRRDLGRIADAMDETTRGSGETSCRRIQNTLPVVVQDAPRIANSAFGR